MNSANFFEPFDPVGPEFLKEPFPNREVHGAGVEDTIERLIEHELDHSSSTFGHAHSLLDCEPGSAIAISPTRIRVRDFNKGRRIAQRSKFPNLGGIC